MRNAFSFTAAAGALAIVTPIALAGSLTSEPVMLETAGAATSNGWEASAIFTVSESLNGFQPVGILDGIGAFRNGSDNRARVLVNQELNPGNGYAYSLQNGTQLTGARVTTFDISRTIDGGGNAVVTLHGYEPAYRFIYDRTYNQVTDPAQINETGNAIDGLARFCSAQGVAKNTYGFEDNLFFTGEETGEPFHPHGGTQWVLDVGRKTLWAVPAVGRGAWENTTPLDTGDPNTVALVLADDTESAPLYLYVGEKRGFGSDRFLDRNGLLKGKLYAWKADAGDLDPEGGFTGLNNSRSGQFVEVPVRDQAMAGQAGYDDMGYLNGSTLRAAADALGCYSFSRPEDVATNPLDGTQFVFASTGRGGLFPSDNWGTTYIVDVDFSDLSADVIIVHDADTLPTPDNGIRSPDNLDWADNGKIYIQEDRSTSPSSLFGGTSGVEASIWELDPITRRPKRVATVDRSVVVPAGTTDIGAGQIGNWETSGVLDVTDLFGTKDGERLLIGTVQAHGIRDGAIGDNPLLDEGGQLFFLSKVGQD